jgi:hypothetical protein
MRKIIYLFTLLLVFSCKNNDKEVEKIKHNSPIEMNTYLSVTIKAKIQEDDKFQLFFSEEVTSQYHPEDIVEVYFKGQDKFQDITFNLPERIYPIKTRIDLGVKKNETPIIIEEIVFSTGTNNRIFKGSEISEYFKPNRFVDLEGVSEIYNRKSIEGAYDPFLISININNIVTNLFKEQTIE